MYETLDSFSLHLEFALIASAFLYLTDTWLTVGVAYHTTFDALDPPKLIRLPLSPFW